MPAKTRKSSRANPSALDWWRTSSPSAGATRVVTIDLHAEQIQGFFDIPVDHLYAGPIIADYLIKEGYRDQNIVVVSPDVAGVPRARAMAEALDAPLAIIAKRRPEPNKVEVMEIIGDVQGRIAIMIDDMIDTGGSVVQGAEALLRRGAERIIAACTHPVFSGNAPQRLAESPIEKVICTDTIPVPPHKQFDKLGAPVGGAAAGRSHLAHPP
jgi:ribose-phosphate pyrophosphokinase